MNTEILIVALFGFALSQLWLTLISYGHACHFVGRWVSGKKWTAPLGGCSTCNNFWTAVALAAWQGLPLPEIVLCGAIAHLYFQILEAIRE